MSPAWYKASVHAILLPHTTTKSCMHAGSDTASDDIVMDNIVKHSMHAGMMYIVCRMST